MKIYLVTAIIALILTTPVSAQDCEQITTIDQIVGNYEITNGPGQLINIPNLGILPAAATATHTARFTSYIDFLGFESEVFGSMIVDFFVATGPDEKFEFGQSDTFSQMSIDDTATVTGCMDSSKLMRIIGSGFTTLPDVGEKPVTMQLIVFPNGNIIGRMDVIMRPPNVTLQTRIQMTKN